MPTISFEKHELFELLGKTLSDEELNEIVNSMGVALEVITDSEITIEVFPNRPDLLSLRGFVRALKFFLGIDKPSLELSKKIKPAEKDFKVLIDKSVSKVRPYTACAIVKNLHLDDEKIKEIIQIQEKLHITFGRNRNKVAIGIYPLEKIKLPIRYLAKKPEDIRFVPLGETKEMSALEILEQHPKGKEYAHLLEGKELFPIFVDANDNVLSMPPIINSELTGKVTEQTKDVFIECSGFYFKDVLDGVNIITSALIDMDAEIYQMELVYPDGKRVTPDFSFEKMHLDLEYVKKYLGLEFKPKEIKQYLEKMGLIYDEKSSEVYIPPYRIDIIHPIDIVEDVAIGYGYNNFPSELSPVFSVAEESKEAILARKIRESLIAHELIEVKNYCLSNPNDETNGILKSWEVVNLRNSWSIDFSVLRRSLIPSILNTFKRNKHYEYPQKIFEIGTVFIPKKNTILEEERLCVALAGSDADYTKIRQILDALARDFDLNLEYNEYNDKMFIEGRSAKVFLKETGKELAVIGELHPQVLENFTIQQPVALFELELKPLLEFLLDKGF
ncbi:MAG: phenylalanyl-tRNA synthetase beta chain [Candidatus Woesearchaeota archaeon]|nr:phenylalanyl-tRNA synthetase beta chain [Candidatus Woesearchaeota archaeon]MDN5327390.1 phenylalanyl-tRNA synthetase beta chain [Candidatus Woesearchaeota archaeon]